MTMKMTRIIIAATLVGTLFGFANMPPAGMVSSSGGDTMPAESVSSSGGDTMPTESVSF